MNHKVLLITGDQRRHRFVANKLCEGLNITSIISEKKKAGTQGEEHIEMPSVIKEHFKKRSIVEEEMFGDHSWPNDIVFKQVESGGSNSEDMISWIKDRQVDVVILYGCGLIKEPLLSIFDKKIINMHLGLSPYYRGAGTNFWPLVDAVPACVGVTIHLAIDKVDAGSILLQVRPEIELNDCSHKIGTKTIIAGAEGLVRAVPAYLNGKIQPVVQDLTVGKVFKRKDFDQEALNKMYENFRNGMIGDYLKNKEENDRAYEIVSFK